MESNIFSQYVKEISLQKLTHNAFVKVVIYEHIEVDKGKMTTLYQLAVIVC